MGRYWRFAAFSLAVLTAAFALACGENNRGDKGADTDDSAAKTTSAQRMQAMMPPLKWTSLADEDLLKVTVKGVSKTYTADQLSKLDKGQLVAYYDEDSEVRGGKPMYFLGVYMKGLMYDANHDIDFNNINSIRLICVDGEERVLDSALASSILPESVLSLQRGAIVTDAQKGCMLVLKSSALKDDKNMVHTGIAQIIVD